MRRSKHDLQHQKEMSLQQSKRIDPVKISLVTHHPNAHFQNMQLDSSKDSNLY